MLSWLRKLFGPRGVSQPPREIQHPRGPVIEDLETMRPRPYYEYFVYDTDPAYITFKVRAYLPRQLEDGSWTYDHKEINSPANSIATARASAQRLGLELIGRKP